MPVLLGYTVTATATEDDPDGAILANYLARLRDYRVIVMDYPNLGKSTIRPAREFTAERACADLLEVADAAGVGRFVWWGFSWGGAIGLQLATRTDRVCGLVCGGWPPLGGLYAELLQVTRIVAANAPVDGPPVDHYARFYESVQGWPEGEAVGRLACPRLAYFGSTDDLEMAGINLPLATTFRARRSELEASGWSVVEIPGRDHSVWTDASTVVPIVRPFLDRLAGGQ